MTNNNCHFTWLKQKETMISFAQSLYKDPTYFDCQLCADGHHFNVHRVILSCNSPILSNILQEHETENPVITLDGVSPLELGALVEFMYTGVTRISPDLLVNFFQTAKSLQLAGLGHYDDSQINKFLAEDGTASPEESDDFQDEYDGYCENILKYLENPPEIDDSEAKALATMGSAPEGGIFLDDRVMERGGLISDNSVDCGKYQNVFVKVEEEEEGEESRDQAAATAAATNLEELNIRRSETDDSVENSDASVHYNKFHSVILNQNDGENGDLLDRSVTTVYSVCKEDDSDIKEENEYITVEDKIQVADEDENYVFVNIDSSVFHRVKESHLSRVKQKKNDSDVCVYSDKYLKVINPVKKNFLIKRPKIQNLVGKDAKANPEDKKIYICLKCGNKYSHRRTLLHHIHWICEQPATYSCSLCPYMGKRKFQLKSHMKHAHMLRMS